MPKVSAWQEPTARLKTYPALTDETHNASLIDELLRTNEEGLLRVDYFWCTSKSEIKTTQLQSTTT